MELDTSKLARRKSGRRVAVAAAGRAADSPRELGKLARMIAAEPVPPAVSAVVLSGIVRLYEFVAIAGLGLLIFHGYVHPHEPLSWRYIFAISGISVATVTIFQLSDLYSVASLRTRVEQLSRVGLIWCAVLLFSAAIAFFVRPEGDFSRIWAATWFGSVLLFLYAGRLFLSGLVRHWTREGRLVRRTVIVGGGRAGEDLIRALDAQRDSDLLIRGVFDDRGDERSPPTVAGQSKLGTVDDLVEFARRTRIDLLLVSLPITAEERVLQMVRKLWVLPVDIRLAAHTSRLRFRPRAYSYIGNVPVLDVLDRPIADWNYVAKWLFDRIVGWLLLIAALPVMAVCAIAIKLDSRGPVFFRQKRYGFNNELIEVFKFRSMYVDQTDATAAKLVTKDDPRVTRVGRLLRRLSLDELPQLINVAIKGDLSLVGPRPHALHAKAENQLYDEVVDGYFARHRVKPGITGWAQINGWRGETDTSEKIQRRVEHDLYYIENWSVLFDCYILARTPFALFATENAY
ncbi:MAG TPA: undecaprenyl-phosphate glucose phosphotransferase [Xanthobacteraceae bacterium]|nr:undecaprenyl-phosphate glucose phosphotransferase [Xanthobacteraceae bacterium]